MVKRTLRRSSTPARCTLDMFSKSMYFRVLCLYVEGREKRVIRELKWQVIFLGDD